MKKEMVCKNCGAMSLPKKQCKGSFWIELALWLIVFPVGIIYTLWRLVTKRLVCPICGAEKTSLIPTHSPEAQKILQSRAT